MEEAFHQSDFVLRIEVDSPVLLTIPHDGLSANDFDTFFARRKDPDDVLEKDMRAWHVARYINAHIPIASMVRGLMPRPMIDYNRSDSDGAFVDDRLARYYYLYHEHIQRLVEQALTAYGKCLLLDIHGFVGQPDFGEFDVILGTKHRTTVVSDIDKDFATFLRDRGYGVYLPTEDEIEGEKFIGRFTVAEHSQPGIDGIQVEIAKRFRVKDAALRRELARSIREFLIEYKNST